MTPEEEKQFDIDYDAYRSRMKGEGYPCPNRIYLKIWEEFKKCSDYDRGWKACREYYSIARLSNE